jgi:hypothetical protein
MKTEILTYEEIRKRVSLARHPAVAQIKDRAIQVMIRKNILPYTRALEPLTELDRTMEEMEVAAEYMGQGSMSHRVAGKTLEKALSDLDEKIRIAVGGAKADLLAERQLLDSCLSKILAEKKILSEREEVKTYFIKPEALPKDADGMVFDALEWMIDQPEEVAQGEPASE